MKILSLNDFKLLLIQKKMTSSSIPTYDNVNSELCLLNEISDYDSSMGIENFFKEFFPHMAFIDYMDIREQSKQNEVTYCSNPSDSEEDTYKEEYIPVDVVYKELVEKQIIQESDKNILTQKDGLTLELFEKIIKDIYKDTDITIKNGKINCPKSEKTKLFSSFSYTRDKSQDNNIDDRIQEYLLKDNIISRKKNSYYFCQGTTHYSSHTYTFNDLLPYDSYSKNKDTHIRIDITNLYSNYMNRMDFPIPELTLAVQKKPTLELG